MPDLATIQQKVINEVDLFLDFLDVAEVTSQASADRALTVLKDIKTKSKALETQRLALTRPLDESKKGIMDLFRDPQAKLDEAEAKLKASLLAFQRAQREEAARIAAEAQERINEAGLEGEVVAYVPPPPPKGLGSRYDWVAEVTDEQALRVWVATSGDPAAKDVLIVNMKRLNDLAKLGEGFDIPGVRAVKREIGVVR